ncbi:zinc finger protein 892-like [Bacillus rossius redtenbacheri]|uniref:zinc finger protein 892-like n=1 Tax=Bacillus rossius redtenbacheri TaxID=93214 RepID=UPI002FDDB068
MEKRIEEGGSFSHFLLDDPLEYESQGCHKMCRLCACLVQEIKVINIFDHTEKNLVMKINRFLADKVYPEDGLPPDVCKGCVAKLNYCDKTISSFIIADRKLRDLFEVDEKSNILTEIPVVVDMEQDSESQDFETADQQKFDDASVNDDTNDSFARELNEPTCSPRETNFDNDLTQSETKYLPSVGSSHCEMYVTDYLQEHGDSSAYQDVTIKNEIFVDQIHGLGGGNFGEDRDTSVIKYDGCNDDANDDSLDFIEKEDCDEYLIEEAVRVNGVLEVAYVDNEGEDSLDLQTEQVEDKFIDNDVDSNDFASEFEEVAGNESFSSSSAQKQFETQFVMCELCGKTLADARKLKSHMMKTHSNDKARVCSVCGKVFKNHSNMRRHMVIHTEKSFTCATCGRAFYNKPLLAQHMLSHSRERPFKCDICGVAYNRHSNMLQHRKLVHANGKDRRLFAYQCSKCGRRLRSELTYKAHLAKHNGGITIFQCETCGKQYKTLELYRVHLRVHTGERPFMCEVCGKSFRGAYTLKQHSWQHRDDCRYSCPYCGRQFKQLYTLIVHKRTHTGEKPFACPICGRCFSQKNDMKKHTKTHDSTRVSKRTVPSEAVYLS